MSHPADCSTLPDAEGHVAFFRGVFIQQSAQGEGWWSSSGPEKSRSEPAQAWDRVP